MEKILYGNERGYGIKPYRGILSLVTLWHWAHHRVQHSKQPRATRVDGKPV